MVLVTGEELRAMGGNPDNQVSIGGKYEVGGGSSGGSADDIMSGSINSILSMFQALPRYDEKNPFSFDEALARQASTAEYTPYYQELLTDYVSDVEKTKSRSSEDLARTLSQLQAGQEYYTGKERRVLDKAIKNTSEGYAGRGLYFSGAKESDIKDLTTEYDKAYGPSGYQTGQYLNQQQTAKTGSERTIADASTLASRYTRDNARDLQYGIETGVQQRKGEAINQYETGRKNYYGSQFGGQYGDYFGSIYS